jgi:shikimate kinase
VNIILTGFMGAGKSTAIGFLSFFYNSYDLDQIIEKATDCKISEIFEKKGEKYFREIEKNIFNMLLDFDNIIIATGGGTLQYYPDLEKLKNKSKVIFLYSSFSILLGRVKNTERPLAKDIKKFESLYFERLPFYLQSADFIVYSDGKDFQDKIIKYLKFIGFAGKKDIEIDIKIDQMVEGIKNDRKRT